MAEDMGGDLTAAQVVRRGLILLDFFLALAPGEVMAVLDTQTDALDRVAIDFDPAERASEHSDRSGRARRGLRRLLRRCVCARVLVGRGA